MAKYYYDEIEKRALFKKSECLKSRESAAIAENAAIVALYSYGRPYPNGSAGDTPKDGFSYFDRDYKPAAKSGGYGR